MGNADDAQFAFEKGRGIAAHREVSTANVDGQLLATDWDPLLSMDHNMNFIGSAGFPPFSVGTPEFHGVGTANSGRDGQIPGLPCFGSKSFPEVVGSFPLCEGSQVPIPLCTSEPRLGGDYGTEKNLKGKKRKGTSETGASHPYSPFEKLQFEQKKNASPKSIKSLAEKDEKKTNSELSPGNDSQKTSNKHAKEKSQNVDTTSKEDYVHVRAKRGQATNSHSLAERVRREKISERMRLLQDLVPGCNKITGKAMMLDEIINYVQSLQRQVEFLSMKLAAVNPEMNFDIEQILSKDYLRSQDISAAAADFVQGTSTPHSHVQGILQTETGMCSIPNSGGMSRLVTSQISPMARIPSVWDHELQNIIPMGFIPNPTTNNKGLNGIFTSQP